MADYLFNTIVDNGQECDPTTNNGVPCVCIFEYSIVISTIEFMCFLGCLVAFFVGNCKKG